MTEERQFDKDDSKTPVAYLFGSNLYWPSGLTGLQQQQATPLYAAPRPSTAPTTYDVVADAVNEVADAATAAFLKAGIVPGEYDGDNIVQDVKRGIVTDILRLAAHTSAIEPTEDGAYRRAWFEWRSIQSGDVQKMMDSALRYKWLRDLTYADRLGFQLPLGRLKDATKNVNLLKGSVAEHLDVAIDKCMAAGASVDEGNDGAADGVAQG